MNVESTSLQKASHKYLIAGVSVFVSALGYYVVFRSQLPWPGYLFNLDWSPLTNLHDPTNGSYPSFAFALSMGLMAVGLFVTKRTLIVTGIVGVWVIGLLHEIFLSTYTAADVMAGTLGALIALRIGLQAAQQKILRSAILASNTQAGKAYSDLNRALFTDRTKLAALLVSSLAFATGTSPYEPIGGSNCFEYDVNGACISEYINGTPVYLSYADLRSAVKVTEPRALTSVSRIYLYNNYLFANEKNEGIHIIDNTVPSSPKKIGFIEIPGNQDIAIRDNALYADSYIDLVTIDVSNVNNIGEIARLEDVFPYDSEQNIPKNVNLIGTIDHTRGVVVGYQ